MQNYKDSNGLARRAQVLETEIGGRGDDSAAGDGVGPGVSPE